MTIFSKIENDKFDTVEELLNYLETENQKNRLNDKFNNPVNLENVMSVNKELIGHESLYYENILSLLLECKASLGSSKGDSVRLLLEKYTTIKKMVLGNQKTKNSYKRRDVMLYELIYIYHNAHVFLSFRESFFNIKKAVKSWIYITSVKSTY